MSTNKVKKLFGDLFSSVEKEIPYDPNLEDEDGYFDLAVSAVRLPSGQLARCTDINDRRIIFIGTTSGTCVVFDRYPDDPDGFVVACAPSSIKNPLQISGPLTVEQLNKLQACA